VTVEETIGTGREPIRLHGQLTADELPGVVDGFDSLEAEEQAFPVRPGGSDAQVAGSILPLPAERLPGPEAFGKLGQELDGELSPDAMGAPHDSDENLCQLFVSRKR
jgi:hypothetical protein